MPQYSAMSLKSRGDVRPDYIYTRAPGDVVIALAGNPNVGKSTLFNRLTGMHQHTGNWTGKTVGCAVGERRLDGRRLIFVDLPGTYSLSPASGEEGVARDFLLSGQADAVIAVCDATRPARTLSLALQIADLGVPCLVCLNLADSAQSRGVHTDLQALAERLGMTVIQTSAKGGDGLDELITAAVSLADSADAPSLTANPCLGCASCDAAARARRICDGIVQGADDAYGKHDRGLDAAFLGKHTAFPILIGFAALLLWLSAWGAGIPSAWLESLFSYHGVHQREFLAFLALPPWLQSMLADGAFDTLCRVVSVMLPPMAIFFPLFALLEDLGYLPRAAACFDRPFAACGTGGKQALTMCMSLGCNAVGVKGCRIIESPRQRLIAILTCSFMPCNGKFATILSICALYFAAGGAGGVLFLPALTALCIITTLAVTRLLTLGPRESSPAPFVLELPSYRMPHPGQVLYRSLIDCTLPMLGRAVLVALPAGILIWLAGAIELGGQSILAHSRAILQPAGTILGVDGAILLAFLLAFPANELFLPSLLAIYGGTDLVGTLSANGWGIQTAICTLILLLFHAPCATTLLTIKRETGSWRQTAIAALLPSVIGVLGCLCVHLIFWVIG